jgi:hypothetical protein
MEIVIKVQARNLIGWSPLSAESTVEALVYSIRCLVFWRGKYNKFGACMWRKNR